MRVERGPAVVVAAVVRRLPVAFPATRPHCDLTQTPPPTRQRPQDPGGDRRPPRHLVGDVAGIEIDAPAARQRRIRRRPARPMPRHQRRPSYGEASRNDRRMYCPTFPCSNVCGIVLKNRAAVLTGSLSRTTFGSRILVPPTPNRLP